MSISLTNRVGRIISGSVNAIMDAVEDSAPEVVMTQAIRDIDSAIDDVRAELGKVVASKHLANKRLSEKNTTHENLAGNIEVAIKEGREDLAEAAVSQQMDIELQMPVLEQSIMDASEQEREFEGYIAALQAKKREMKEELKSLKIAIDEGDNGSLAADGTVSSGNGIQKKVNDATSAFDEVMERQTGLAGDGPGDAAKQAKVAELEKLAHANRVKERLEAIKSSINVK